MKQAAPDSGGQPRGLADFTSSHLTALLRRALRLSASASLPVALAAGLAAGWRAAALFAVGAALSIASIYEWGRTIRMANARMEGERSAGPGSGLGWGVVAALFLLRLMVFAAVIYGSLKCFQLSESASAAALLGGLAMGLAGLAWEAMRALRG